jgi:uncharacterized protein (TIGR01777 family)
MEFLSDGHQVTTVDLPPEQTILRHDNLTYISADTTLPGEWQEKAGEADTVINLAGVSIFGRWTTAYKKKIYESRILTTRNIADAIQEGKKMTLISTSAVGFYGWRGNEILTEEAPPGDDFLSTVCQDWEREALRAQEKGARVVVTRFGIVLGKSGGVLGAMIPLFKLFIGGKLGKGTQWFSWVHSRDLTGGIKHISNSPSLQGPVNLCSPIPVTNYTLTKTLAKIMHRPSFLPAPAFAIKVALGEFADNILRGQRVIPQKIMEDGFTFSHPELETALREILQK